MLLKKLQPKVDFLPLIDRTINSKMQNAKYKYCKCLSCLEKEKNLFYKSQKIRKC